MKKVYVTINSYLDDVTSLESEITGLLAIVRIQSLVEEVGG